MADMMRRLHLLVAMPEAVVPAGQTFAEYEAGKRRRYDLLFAVNGGAFALCSWLAGKDMARGIAIGGLDDVKIGLGMAGFAAIMCLDLFAFGLRFRAFFGLPGKLVIIGLGTLLISGWLLAGQALGHVAPLFLLPPEPPLALLAPLIIAVLAALLACFTVRLPPKPAVPANPTHMMD